MCTPRRLALGALLALAATGCRAPEGTTLTVAASRVGAEGAVLEAQLQRFAAQHPGVHARLRDTPDAADQRHQLYVQWLNAHAPEPDVLQLDVVWTPELAAAGWLAPLDGRVDTEGFAPAALEASRAGGRLYAVPWFVDVGMLYWRSDLLPHAPASLDELAREARQAQARGLAYGFVWPGARYEGLVTTFDEVLGGFGGRLDALLTTPAPGARPPAERALGYLRALLDEGASPPEVLAWQEEQVRFAFQNGQALFMRNWPYAAPLLADAARSQVAGRFQVAQMPAQPGGAPTAALGGAVLALNARSRAPALAAELIAFLTAPAQLVERAARAGQYPPRLALYDDPEVIRALPVPAAEARALLASARPRPAGPLWAAQSDALQVELHAALSGQLPPGVALARAAEAERVLSRAAHPPPSTHGGLAWLALVVAGALAVAAWVARQRRRLPLGRAPASPAEARLALLLCLPALALVAAIAFFPLAFTAWESLHHHDLRLPATGRPFVGLGNYAAAFESRRFWEALLHTALFAAATVTLELALGLAAALALARAVRGRGLLRAAVLLPWALPTVVAGLIWRFFFEGRAGLANRALALAGRAPEVWLASPRGAWVPLILADVWKTTPFVALLLLAGLSTIDPTLYEAAAVDGAGPLARLREITLPLLRPALLVALLFRTLDAVRVFDLAYVLTGGGPGTATEPLGLYAWSALFTQLRFGYGAALALLLFLLALVLALAYLRALGRRP